jgi:hypothetical protein
MFENHCDFGSHFTPDLMVVPLRQFAALELEVEILDIAQKNFFLPLEQIPLGFLDDGGFDAVVPSK